MKSTTSYDKHEARGIGFKHLTPPREAIQKLLQNVSVKLEDEEAAVDMSLSRIIARDIFSSVDVPPFDRSAMDGFAVKAEDTYSASTSTPITLRLVSELHIEDTPSMEVRKNQCASIVTGAQLPAGSNAVVMVEYTKRLNDTTIEIFSEVRPGENVSRQGEDVSKGAVILRRGTMILPQDIGMLTALGARQVTVVRKPRVTVLSSGSELRDHSTSTGKIIDVNRPMLIAACQNLGCAPMDLGIVTDDYEAIRAKLLKGLQVSDVILLTAGTSVGPEDIVPKVIDSLGQPGMLVHGVAMRPSMPTGLAVVNGKPIISLPGYPVSAYLAFIEFVRPLIAHLLRTRFLPAPTVRVKLNRRVPGVLGSRTYVRVKVTSDKDGLVAEPIRTSGAGILSSLVQANGFIIVPENVEGYEEGALVDVELFRPKENTS
jgi:molybdenum cofactor synthesis domain-containing protein